MARLPPAPVRGTDLPRKCVVGGQPDRAAIAALRADVEARHLRRNARLNRIEA